MSDEQIVGIAEFARQVAQGLEAAEENFRARRRIVEEMDVQVMLAVEDGEKVAYIRCLVEEDRQCLADTPSHTRS